MAQQLLSRYASCRRNTANITARSRQSSVTSSRDTSPSRRSWYHRGSALTRNCAATALSCTSMSTQTAST
eukprot:CAMPEP_0173169382 /NCGR_PEP_ID=MMETSP1141-20130122/675_1 /TAXON_ID=483371 /ORGANISM="non described non described, Strain CCMP2298" /LENGTH=69 /DNA_ID=CAMNT_0014091207 /DNA_START=385 /DNA_END=594 /DNA_ORIENTATION=+